MLEARGVEAVRLLFRSAVGLDPGSTILERVTGMQSALTRASAVGTLGCSTSALFERAVRAAWRAQGETALGQSPIMPEWELERPECERIVVPASTYPPREPTSTVRLVAAAATPGLRGKAVA